MPNFSDRDMNDLLRVTDTNGNGVVEYEELLGFVAFYISRAEVLPVAVEGESPGLLGDLLNATDIQWR